MRTGRWSLDEAQALWDFYNQGLPLGEIAERLNRSIQGCVNKIGKLERCNYLEEE